MKEKDLDRVIDDMITEGLIREGEQDNADFEAAVRNMSDEDFLAMIYEAHPQYEPEDALMCGAQAEEEVPANGPGKQKKPWRVWMTSAVAAAAVLAIVLIPAYRSMNSRICESALMACEAYMPPARGGLDMTKADAKEIKESLPSLEAEYADAVKDREPDVRYAYIPNLAEAGWDLAMAYLRLGERSKARDVLTTLAARYPDDEFGEQCRRIAEIL